MPEILDPGKPISDLLADLCTKHMVMDRQRVFGCTGAGKDKWDWAEVSHRRRDNSNSKGN